MIDPCKEREPRVIDNALIEKCIDLNYPKGEYGRLLREEGMPMEEVEEIRFEYLYILKIDHLWVLKSLTKLSLANNFIEKIENLETLIHLRELDFSFNRIKQIENLSTLENLEKISFYSNKIEIVENLENQTKLTVFSIGKNNVVDKTTILYFRKFLHLTSLNMAENPCTEEPDFRLYIAAYLPNLIYYEYQRISDLEREQGLCTSKTILRNTSVPSQNLSVKPIEVDPEEPTAGTSIEIKEHLLVDVGLNIYHDHLRKLERTEEEEKEQSDAILKENSDRELHSLMFVENLHDGQLFDEMFKLDPEGKTLLEIGEDVTELYEEYRNQFVEYSRQIFQIGHKHYETRQNEVDLFIKSTDTAKNENQEESINFMETFLDAKYNMFAAIKDIQLQLEHDAITEEVYKEKVEEFKNEFKEKIHETWKNLMRLEMRLYDQMEDVNTLFEQTLNDMINTFIEEEQAVFTNLRAAEVTYSENVNDAAVRFMTALNLNPDEEEVSAQLKDILIDRDSINNAIAATHDIHMQTIDKREDILIKQSKDWAQTLVVSVMKTEIERNRYKLLEINHFLDIQKQEFEEFTNPPINEVPPEEYDD